MHDLLSLLAIAAANHNLQLAVTTVCDFMLFVRTDSLQLVAVGCCLQLATAVVLETSYGCFLQYPFDLHRIISGGLVLF